jgi:hypothetical protein
MPFAGSAAEALVALAALDILRVAPGDELILADNSATAPTRRGVTVVPAPGERSPSRARNAGAQRARGEWILFLDADCAAPPDLLDRYFEAPIADDVGALAGAVVPAPGARGFAARYGAAKSFLDQDAHLAHAYMPRAVAANLLVRRAAFEAVGGFYEGLRAAEDTDFSWRLQRAGWRLQSRPAARVEHRYRTTVRALRRQWRGYAAGRAWLARRYDGFEPEPALRRAAGRALHHGAGGSLQRLAPRAALSARPGPGTAVDRLPPPPVADSAPPGRLLRGGFLALDALLGFDELAGLALSNRPPRPARGTARVVLVAGHFPAAGDPLADFAVSLAGARVEAAGRPEQMASGPARELAIDYREDDGVAARIAALAWLLARHPLRCARDLVSRGPGQPGLAALAPAVARLRHEPDAHLRPLGGDEIRAPAARLAALAGRRLG